MHPSTRLPEITTSRGLLALSPVAVFLCLYLVVSIAIGDFYKMPLSVALLVASVWSIVIYRRGGTLVERIETFSRSAGHANILYMIWIFILAGAFAALAKEIGAIDATVNFTLRFFPSQFIVPALFVASCFISLSIGTSVGTVVALTPLAVEMANASGACLPFYVAVVLGGAFFGDNLSFISDTTIAATRSQGCQMADKFKANLWICVPAAIITLLVYVVMSLGTPEVSVGDDANPVMILPYIVVLVAAVMGVNVTVVLSLGIITALALGLFYGHDIISLFGYMGTGIDSMGDLIIVTLLAAGMLGVIKGRRRHTVSAACAHLARVWTAGRAGVYSHSCSHSQSVHGQQYRCHHHGRRHIARDRRALRSGSTQKRIAARLVCLYRAVSHPLRSADPPGLLAGRDSSRCSIRLSLLSLGVGSDGSVVDSISFPSPSAQDGVMRRYNFMP